MLKPGGSGHSVIIRVSLLALILMCQMRQINVLVAYIYVLFESRPLSEHFFAIIK